MPLGIDEAAEVVAAIEAPWLLAGAAAAAVLLSPKLRQGARAVIVKAAAGVLTVADQAKQAAEQMAEGWQDMLAEARAEHESAKNGPPRPGGADSAP